jgi:hypothetical protein
MKIQESMLLLSLGPHHLDFGDHLLRVRRSPRFRDDTGTILGELGATVASPNARSTEMLSTILEWLL